MNQTRLGSLIEAAMGTAIGLLTNLGANMVIYPAFGWHPTMAQNVALTLIFTVISIVRGYLLRRYFNARLQRAARSIAKAVQ